MFTYAYIKGKSVYQYMLKVRQNQCLSVQSVGVQFSERTDSETVFKTVSLPPLSPSFCAPHPTARLSVVYFILNEPTNVLFTLKSSLENFIVAYCLLCLHIIQFIPLGFRRAINLPLTPVRWQKAWSKSVQLFWCYLIQTRRQRNNPNLYKKTSEHDLLLKPKTRLQKFSEI